MKEKDRGFTFVELLVAASILSVISVVVVTSFRTGLAAYARSEENLTEKREGDVFLTQLAQELRNAIPFSLHPFVGEGDTITFPTRLVQYTPEGMKEELVLIQYRIHDGALIRTELKLRKSLLEPVQVSDVLFEGIDAVFDFLYLDDSNELSWETDWSNKPYVGLPRGVRIKLSRDIFGEGRTSEILIPHGVLLRRSS
ncbi:MAG: hypothetical protein A3G87_04305 [Omnitrophica bacterium RIFCSPLOWO2_12_FULL_50_11]|nr:MAG: hypothetical protein A3G87_04305 [Omnitrophica bacterium RIFCSPLOWO2_12_FULL_50_11]